MKYLILGGARSGKSLFAENLCLKRHEKLGNDSVHNKLIYLATCPKAVNSEPDDEIAARIKLHQARRGQVWQTIEVPLKLAEQIKQIEVNSVVLIDCLTLWISNLMFAKLDISTEFDQLLNAITASEASIFMVSNEVGMGLVPETAIGREFRDLQGKLNQEMAQRVDKVALIVAGLPIWVKQ